jgi:hypothetical protein
MLDVSVGATKARALWCVRGAGLAALALLLSLASASALAQDSEVSEGEPVSPATEEPVALEIEGEVSSEIEGESLSSEPMSSELVLLEPESTEPVRIAASEAAMLEDEEPEVTVVTRPRRRAHAGNLLWNAVVGDVVGGAAGALLAVALAALPACPQRRVAVADRLQLRLGLRFRGRHRGAGRRDPGWAPRCPAHRRGHRGGRGCGHGAARGRRRRAHRGDPHGDPRRLPPAAHPRAGDRRGGPASSCRRCSRCSSTTDPAHRAGSPRWWCGPWCCPPRAG